MERRNLLVIGGSASNNFGKVPDTQAWPKILEKNLGGNTQVTHVSHSGLTFVRGMNELANVDSVDLIIMHFGTSIGWPISMIQMGTKAGIDFDSEVAFNQPPYRSAQNKLKKDLRRLFRNTVKYVLFLFGLYRPRVSRKELSDQIDVVINLAKLKCEKLVWVQHRAFLKHRIVLEKATYDRYYLEIMKALKSRSSDFLQIVEIPDDFMTQENYLFDCVHLSSSGHVALERIIRRSIS
jgi:hypothetical protein